MKAKSPVANQIRLKFFVLLAFFLEQSWRSIIEDTISPISVKITGGRNQSDTSLHNHGKGLRLTARKEKIAATIAAVLSPWVTAIVLMLWDLSPSTSTIPFVISLPVFERKAMAANSKIGISICPTVKPP